MAGKYDKYFLTDSPWKKFDFVMGPIIQRMDTKTIEGSNFYFIHWVLPHDKPHMTVGHPAHIHSEAELLIHIGTNPADPDDLGAEVELCMGPEMEKHIITRSTIICLPANFVHGPWRILKVTRPFMIVTVNQSTKHTEKALRDMVSKEDHKRMIFMDAGYEDEGIPPRFDWPEAAGPRADYM